jgi:hypothetical protein
MLEVRDLRFVRGKYLLGCDVLWAGRNLTVPKILLPPSEGHRIERRYTPEDVSPPHEKTVLAPNIAVFD